MFYGLGFQTYKPNLQTKPTNQTYQPNLPTKPTNQTYQPNLPTKPTNQTYKPNLPTKPTNSVPRRLQRKKALDGDLTKHPPELDTAAMKRDVLKGFGIARVLENEVDEHKRELKDGLLELSGHHTSGLARVVRKSLLGVGGRRGGGHFVDEDGRWKMKPLL